MFKKHRIRKYSIFFFCIFILAYFIYFPGQQSSMAFVIGTGLFKSNLQNKIKAIEMKVQKKETLSESEKVFLSDLYTCFYKGAKVTYVFRQTAFLMEHYLAGSGENIIIDSRIFVNSGKVKRMMKQIKYVIKKDCRNNNIKKEYISKLFPMGDPEFLDSFTGLYYGKLIARIKKTDKEVIVVEWKADHPWFWPSFSHIEENYKNIASHNFPLPNMMSFIFGKKHCLYINDGLGAYLVDLNLAKPFNVYAYWHETIAIEEESFRL